MRVAKWSSFEEWRAGASERASAESECANRPECPYCRAASQMVTGAAIYPHLPALHSRNFYLCAPCDAWVGCHPGTTKALGTLADKRLRLARKNAHAVFDPIWRVRCRHDGVPRHVARPEAYEWLAAEMKMPPARCHIALMDIEDCLRVIDICQRLHKQRRQQQAKAQAQPLQRAWVHPDLRKPEAYL